MYVYVTEFADEEIQNALDLLRVMVNPRTRRKAHLSLRGPYSEVLSPDLLTDLNAVVSGLVVNVVGVGRFTEPEQTVYLVCDETPRLQRLWDKPDWGFTPHISIYNGMNSGFADDVFSILLPHSPAFSSPLTPLREYEVGKYVADESPRTALTGALALELGLREGDIDRLPEAERLRIVESLLDTWLRPAGNI